MSFLRFVRLNKKHLRKNHARLVFCALAKSHLDTWRVYPMGRRSKPPTGVVRGCAHCDLAFIGSSDGKGFIRLCTNETYKFRFGILLKMSAYWFKEV